MQLRFCKNPVIISQLRKCYLFVTFCWIMKSAIISLCGPKQHWSICWHWGCNYSEKVREYLSKSEISYWKIQILQRIYCLPCFNAYWKLFWNLMYTICSARWGSHLTSGSDVSYLFRPSFEWTRSINRTSRVNAIIPLYQDIDSGSIAIAICITATKWTGFWRYK